MTIIPIDTSMYGMVVRGRTIYYCTGDKGLQMLNLSDKSVSIVIHLLTLYPDDTAMALLSLI
jgi:hypothetical protein